LRFVEASSLPGSEQIQPSIKLKPVEASSSSSPLPPSSEQPQPLVQLKHVDTSSWRKADTPPVEVSAAVLMSPFKKRMSVPQGKASTPATKSELPQRTVTLKRVSVNNNNSKTDAAIKSETTKRHWNIQKEKTPAAESESQQVPVVTLKRVSVTKTPIPIEPASLPSVTLKRVSLLKETPVVAAPTPMSPSPQAAEETKPAVVRLKLVTACKANLYDSVNHHNKPLEKKKEMPIPVPAPVTEETKPVRQLKPVTSRKANPYDPIADHHHHHMPVKETTKKRLPW